MSCFSFFPAWRSSLVLAALVLGVGVSGCGISEQVQQAKAFQHAEIRLASIEQATVAGVDVTQIRRPRDLNMLDQARLAAAYASGNLPLRLRVNLEIRNPNNEMAALNELDYIALLDDKQVATGRTTERIEVPGGGVAIAPLTLESNLRETLRESSGDALANLVLGLADQDEQSLRLTLRIRPTFITRSGRRITPAGYINVKKEFTASQLLEVVD